MKYIFAVILFLAGIFFSLFCTQKNNLTYTIDSVQYVKAAKSIANGTGFAIEQADGKLIKNTHWTPLYSLSIAITSKILNVDEIQAPRYLNAFNFGIFLLVSYIILLQVIYIPIHFSIILTLLLALTNSVSTVYMSVWSETIFGIFFLIMLLCLPKYNIQNKKLFLNWFVIGILGSCLIMARYAGIGFIPGFVIIILLSKEKISNKLIQFIVFISPIIVTMLWWVTRNKAINGTTTDREFIKHLPNKKQLIDFYETILNFIFPINNDKNLSLLVLIIFLYIILLFYKSIIKKIVTNSLVQTYLILIISYTIFLFFVSSFLDANMPFNYRILFPNLILIFFILSIVFKESFKNIKVKSLALFMLLLSFLLHTQEGIKYYKKIRNEGMGYTSSYWTKREIFPYIKENYLNTIIYTNDPSMIYMNLGKLSHLLPIKVSLTQNKQNSSYNLQMKEMEEDLKKGGIIVYFTNLEYNYLPTENELMKNLPISLYKNLNRENIYVINP